MRAILAVVLTGIASTSAAADVGRGERLYGQWCQGCHDRLGPTRETMPGTTPLDARYQGTRPAALVDRNDLTPEFIKVFVRQGISFMPTFRKTELSDAELDDIVAFLVRKQPTK
ncbi:mono/diheme cytochrome c family protein [Povalibacter uvarum]|uniref:Mono/diheme cytochrome c family protein n=1 Tax=Povalibacter uvarum TaxID=732238 RepID=A0A841HWW9_9GAMM|nr:cytochrome c [Povalibacter uvarum]MBB6096452.1 mono/diheme cytochrome c family protein [Povalibacter uvarum]